MSDITERVKKIVVEHLGVDEAKVTDPKAKATVSGTHLLKCGKRNFVRIVAG